MTPAISVAGLTRNYRGLLAVDHATFDLEPGSITGLLGRNGAGKPVTGLCLSLLPERIAGPAGDASPGRP